MTTIGGPKGPGRSPALQRFLDTERAKSEQAKRAEDEPTQTMKVVRPDSFSQDAPSVSGASASGMGAAILTGSMQRPGSTGSPGAGALSLQLGAMTGQTNPEPFALTGIRVITRKEGRVVVGDAHIQSARDIKRLADVTRVEGTLSLSETLLDTADLSALSSLTHVDGGLTVEGNAAVSALEHLGALTHVGGSVYLGFNDELERISLPNLQSVGGPLIIEGNDALKELDLPALTQVGGYLHLHENEQLAQVSLGALTDVGGELSVLENPRLLTVEMRALEHVSNIEMSDNGADKLGGLPRFS